jgi:simple sugar transport system ATP-binding protein
MDYAIEMLNIMKTYPGIVANDNVTMLVKKGEIHALLGENSSGKSTLIGILSGLIVPDAGTIKIDGRQAVLKNAADAGRLGIGTVYQDMKLAETMTVLENIFLGAEDTRFGFLYRKKTRTAISELIEKYGLDVDPDAAVKHLSAEMRQRVEILKALYRGNDIFIFDNPTQALTPVGAKNFVKILHALSAQGKTIIIVTSNIRDITGIADSCTVMKRGKSVASVKVSEVKPEELYALMAGEKSAKIPKKEAQADGSVLFEMQDVCFGMLKNVSLQVKKRRDRSVAVAKGNGQRELAKTAVGYSIPISGRIMIKGEDMTKRMCVKKPLAASLIFRRTGSETAWLPKTIWPLTLRCGITASGRSRARFSNLKKMKSYAESMIAAYNIPVYNGAQSLLGGMSGGNQQKIIIARELHTNPDIVIADQPFKGLDNLSIEMLYKELNNLKMAQKGILMLSPDVEVITEISDRIYVMAEGSIVAEYDGASADAQKIGEQMSAQTQEAV